VLREKTQRKQQSIEAMQEYRLQEIKDALQQEQDPQAIVIFKYSKKVI